MSTKNIQHDVPHSVLYAQQQLSKLNPNDFSSLPSMFEKVCNDNKSAVAYSCMGKDIDYGELNELSRSMAAYLVDVCNLKKGDRIAIQLPNILQYPVVAWGALRAGLVIVNTNPLYTAREMLHQFNDSGAKALVVLSDLLPKAQALLKDTSIKTVISTSFMDLLATKASNNQSKAQSSPGILVDFNDAIQQGSLLALPDVIMSMNDLALLQYTGGTTGVAKGAMLSHGNVFSAVRMTREFLKDVVIDREVIIAPMPLYHVYGFTMNVVSVLSVAGTSVLIPDPRDANSIIDAMKRHTPTGMAGVNTLFQSLMEHPKFDEIDFTQLRGAIGGGTALVKEIADEWQSRTNQDIYEGYGLTETAGVLSCNIEGKRRLGTVGMAFDFMQVRAVGEDGSIKGAGEEGELWVRGPHVMQGYWKRDEATSEVLDEDGWFRTGDVAIIEDDGYIRIVDRLKDMVLVSGFNVYPTEIESVVYTHPDVVECAVIGVKDAKTGEAVKLFVNSKNPSLSADELKEYCRKELTNYKVPKLIEFMKELPKSSVGKILRRELRGNN